MEVKFWIAVEGQKKYRKWEKKSVRVAQREKPALKPNEIAFKVNLEIPDSYFSEPNLKLNIKLPDNALPEEIPVELQENVSQAIRDQMGPFVRVEVETINE